MKKLKIVLCISCLIVSLLSSCGKQEPIFDLKKIDVSDISKVEHTGTTGEAIPILYQKPKATNLFIC